MTLTSFQAQPRKGYLDQAKRFCSYLSHLKHFKIWFKVDELDFSTVLEPSNFKEWSDTAYGHNSEDIPPDASPPLGIRVFLSHYDNASLMNGILNRKTVTGVLHFYNKTPIDWYCKKQATAEIATYGAKFSACRTYLEQVIDHIKTTSDTLVSQFINIHKYRETTSPK